MTGFERFEGPFIGKTSYNAERRYISDRGETNEHAADPTAFPFEP
jgi:hypothetical protein